MSPGQGDLCSPQQQALAGEGRGRGGGKYGPGAKFRHQLPSELPAGGLFSHPERKEPLGPRLALALPFF